MVFSNAESMKLMNVRVPYSVVVLSYNMLRLLSRVGHISRLLLFLSVMLSVDVIVIVESCCSAGDEVCSRGFSYSPHGMGYSCKGSYS